MSTCIRRHYTRWTTCTCDPCQADRRRNAKLARNGRITRVPSELAWARIDHFTDRGWSSHAIASAAGVSDRLVESAMSTARTTGKRQTFGPHNAAKLAALRDDAQPTRGLVGAHGARRRLQALATIGHNIEALSDASGIARMTLYAIRRGDTSTIATPLHHQIAALYEQHQATEGPATQAARNARRRRWPNPERWTTDTIDDPHAKPLGRDEIIARRHADQLDDLEHLARTGCTIHEAAQRMGIRTDSIDTALRRANRTDVLDFMRRNDPNWTDPARTITYEEGRRIVAHVAGAADCGPHAGVTLGRAS